MMISVGLITLGCPKNQVDSEIMLGLLDQAQYQLSDDVKKADVVIINTCGFIESAKEESINTILQLAKLKEIGALKFLVVTGCLAQRYETELKAEIPEIDAVLGTGNFHKIPQVIAQGLEGMLIDGISSPEFEYRKDLPRLTTTPDYTAYVKIAEGCNNRCSYCIIPALRGPLRSRPIGDVVEEVKDLAQKGVKELILVAQDTTVYGLDLYGEPRLVSLLKEIVCIEGIHWIRIMYSYPDHMDRELIKLIAQEEKICNYLDLPLQHGSDQILDLMNRPTRRNEVIRLIREIRQIIPDVAIRTSLIVGFPGEKEENFQELTDFVREMEFDRLGVFTYSREENTPAHQLPDHLSETVKEERWDKIMALQKEIALSKNEAMIGQVVEVLVEEVYSKEEQIVVGRTQWDAPEIDNTVYCHQSTAQVGDFIQVKITDALEYDLIGEESR